ncbi:MAG TPA: hypothetical protein PKN85_02820 [Syntrophorhabdaceae bacterium]|nr:hypothetical protein [Syntrophorhabdaceae bacterium]HOD74662.1 hypothetical protein [Syntrophorhabdaceae bacterium]
MAMIDEKKIRAYHSRSDNALVCPLCATDEERESAEPGDLVTEDVIHDDNPMYCARCKKKIEKQGS